LTPFLLTETGGQEVLNMINNRPGFKLIIIFQTVVFLALAVGDIHAAEKKGNDNKKDQT